MHIRDYIQGAYEAIAQGVESDRVLKNLQTYLTNRGMQKLYPRVLRGLLERIRRGAAYSTPRVRIARAHDALQFKEEIQAGLSRIGIEHPETVIDETLIGGFIVQGENERIDASYKSTLLQVYQRLIK